MTRNIALTAVTGGALIVASLTACRPATEQVLPDVANAAFVVDGNRYLLQAGYAARPHAPQDASFDTLRLVPGEQLFVDFNGDGAQDALVHLVHGLGGNKSFHYIGVVMNRGKYAAQTKTIFLGDRIRSVKMMKDDTDWMPFRTSARVIYRGHTAHQSVAEAPTIEKTLLLRFDYWKGQVVLAGFSLVTLS